MPGPLALLDARQHAVERVGERRVHARLGQLADHLLVEAARRLLGHEVLEGVGLGLCRVDRDRVEDGADVPAGGGRRRARQYASTR